MVAAVDDSSVFIRGMPDLRAVPAAAFPAFDFIGEDADTAVAFFAAIASCDFRLHQVEHFGRYDGFMVTRYVILRYLPLILLETLGKVICCIPFLQQGIALIFFIRQDTLDHACPPLAFPGRGRQFSSRQFLRNRCHRKPAHIEPIQQFYRFRLFGVYNHHPIRAFVIAKEIFIAYTDLTICKAFSLSPGSILRNTPALFLCQRTHDGDEQFAF